MKTFLSLLLLATTALASDVRLAWDASETSGITNYAVYISTNAPVSVLGSTNTLAPVRRIDAGTNTAVTITNLTGGNWIIVATAMKDGDESEPSNAVNKSIPTPPQNLRFE
jgi:hypothetical protein